MENYFKLVEIRGLGMKIQIFANKKKVKII